MRNVKTVARAAGTAAVVAFSLLLPDLVARVQDEANAGSVARFATNRVEFGPEQTGDAMHALEVFARSSVLLDVDAGGRMSRDEVHAAVGNALAAFDGLGQHSFSGIASSRFEEAPMLAIDDSRGQAAVLWECVVTSEENARCTATAYVDDATGKVISLVLAIPGDGTELGPVAPEAVLAWAQAHADYLGFAWSSVGGEDDGSSAADEESDDEAATQSSEAYDGYALSENAAVVRLGETTIGLAASYSELSASTSYVTHPEETAVSGENQQPETWVKYSIRPVILAP